MRYLLIVICLFFLHSRAHAQIQLTPYIAISQKQVLADSKDIAEGMVTNFAIANKADIKKFRYEEFDKALSQMHPVIVWATLRYLNDRATGARKEHIQNYLAKSHALKSLNESFGRHPESAAALEYFESKAPKGGFSKVSEKNFLKLIDKVIVVIKSKQA